MAQCFAFFFFFAPTDSRFSNRCISAKYYPILKKHRSVESIFISKRLTHVTGFVVQGYILEVTSHNLRMGIKYSRT